MNWLLCKIYFNQIFSGSPSLTLTRTSTTRTAFLTTYPPTMVPTTTHQHLGRPCVGVRGRSPMTSWAAGVHWPFCSTPQKTSPWERGLRLSTTWLKVGCFVFNVFFCCCCIFLKVTRFIVLPCLQKIYNKLRIRSFIQIVFKLLFNLQTRLFMIK